MSNTHQVKSKQRVADHGEVFTNEREVKAMLDLVWKNLEKGTIDKILTATFLEPSCGSGNFLIEILRRKLNLLIDTHKEKSLFDFNLVRLVGSIYGVELLPDNAEECRTRLLAEIKKYYPKKFIIREADYDKLMASIRFVISQNIICGNALDYTTEEGKPIIFTHWAGSLDKRTITMNYFDYGYLTDKKEGMMSLFADQTIRPSKELHYTDLGQK